MKKRVLGIDVGTAIMGWGVIDITTSGYEVVSYGTVTTSPKLSTETRLLNIFDGLDTLIKEFKPDEMAVEDLFFFKNQKTVIKVGQARGVILLAGVKNGLEIANYTPLQVKQAVSGYGRAEKKTGSIYGENDTQA